jgi:hypothetical protein
MSSIICTVHQILLAYQIKEDKMGEVCSERWTDEKCLQNLVRMPEGKRSLWRFGRGYKNNIKVDLTELVLEGVD